MHKRFGLVCLLVSMFTLAALGPEQQKTMGLEKGSISLKSLDKLAFGNDGILFLADANAARIYAMATQDAPLKEAIERIEIRDIDEKLASLLGTTPKEVFVRDLAINQSSKNAYLAVRRGSGDKATHHLFKVKPDGAMTAVSLENIPHAHYDLNGVPAEDAVGRRNRKMRPYSVTSMGFADNILFVAGVSNEAFTSTVRRVAFPFQATEKKGTIEIYHVAHQAFETHAPVTSLVPWDYEGKKYMVTGFTCTPLVVFPMKDFGNGEKVKGKTVAELGAGNTPVDIRSFTYEGKQYFLVANNRRQLMCIEASDVAKQEALTTPMKKNWNTKGVPFTALPGNPAQQLDVLDKDHMVVMRRNERGTLDMFSYPNRLILGIWN